MTPRPQLSQTTVLLYKERGKTIKSKVTQRLLTNHSRTVGQSIQNRYQSTMVDNRKEHRQNSHLIIHFPTSEGVSEVSERANEWAVRANERTDERVAQYLRLDSCLFQTTVEYLEEEDNWWGWCQGKAGGDSGRKGGRSGTYLFIPV